MKRNRTRDVRVRFLFLIYVARSIPDAGKWFREVIRIRPLEG